MKSMKKFSFFWMAGALALTASSAQAHTNVGSTAGFAHGFAHPVGGWDHLLAMFAVGLWASQLAQGKNNKKALFAVPLAFIAAMIAGGFAGASHIALPFVEEGILLSVLVLGVLVAATARLPLALSIAVVGLFALFHGHAHGAEMPETASGLMYGLGFVLATALLHTIGVAAGVLSQKSFSMQITRFAGAAIALSSVVLFVQK